MFQRILVPLDGSTRAEQAIPVAARIAHATGGSLILLRVVSGSTLYEGDIPYPGLLLANMIDADVASAQHNLSAVARRDDLDGVALIMKVLVGIPADIILAVVQEEGVDLITMSSHGHTGIKRLVLGSTAQIIGRRSPVPVFVLRDGDALPTCPYPDRLRPLRGLMGLVALDGTEMAEAALAPVAHLVAALAAPARGILSLAQVIPPLVHGEPLALPAARAYLRTVAERVECGELAALHLGIVTSVARGEDIASTLVKTAQDGAVIEGTTLLGQCNLIAMATHGRQGWQRWTMGSITEHVLGMTTLPLLVVPPPIQQTMVQHKQPLVAHVAGN